MALDMTVGEPRRLIGKYFYPLFLGNCFQQLYNVADSIIVGKGIGDEALAAVGATASIQFLNFGFIIGLNAGVSYLMAQAFGEKDADKLRKITAMSFMVCGICAVLLGIGSFCMAERTLLLLQTPSNILQAAVIYLKITSAGLIVTFGYNFCARLLEAIGDSKTPFYAVIMGCIINIALDLILIKVFGMGVSGSAYGTVLAQAGSVIFVLAKLKNVHIVRLHAADWKPAYRMVRQILIVGLSTGLMNSITAVGNVMLQFYVNGLGWVYTTAYSVCTRLFGFFEQPGMALGMTMGVFAGQNKGAGSYDRISSGLKICLLSSLSLNLLLGAIEVSFPGQLAGIMISSPKVILACEQFLPLGGYCLWVLGFLFVFRYACQGMSHTVVPMLSGLLEMAVRIGIVVTAGKTLGFFGVGVAEISAWAGAAVLLMLYFRRIFKRESRAAADALSEEAKITANRGAPIKEEMSEL